MSDKIEATVGLMQTLVAAKVRLKDALKKYVSLALALDRTRKLICLIYFQIQCAIEAIEAIEVNRTLIKNITDNYPM